MQHPLTFLFVFAHPDDETFLTAGTMAALIERGSRIVMCSATRGEEGEIAEVTSTTREALGEVREGELRAAMAEVGVHDVRFLGYRDSGMAGTATNDADGAFMRVPTEEAGRKILDLIDEVRPDVVIGFGPEGVYLHPDHIAAHLAMRSAIKQSMSDESHHRIGAMLYAAVPRETFVEIWHIEGNPFSEFALEEVKRMGTPLAEITHKVDGEQYRETVLAALKRHRTQFGDGDPFDFLPPHLAKSMLRYNYYKQASLAWKTEELLLEPFTSMG